MYVTTYCYYFSFCYSLFFSIIYVNSCSYLGVVTIFFLSIWHYGFCCRTSLLKLTSLLQVAVKFLLFLSRSKLAVHIETHCMHICQSVTSAQSLDVRQTHHLDFFKSSLIKESFTMENNLGQEKEENSYPW